MPPNHRLLLLLPFIAAGCQDRPSGSASPEGPPGASVANTGSSDHARSKVDVESTTSFKLRPDEILGQKDPARWLKAYLKYHQLLSTAWYSQEPALCETEATSPEPALKPIQNPKAVLDQAKQGLNTVVAQAKQLTRSTTQSVTPLQGVRPLHLAAMFCEEATARSLVEHGANVNATDLLGLTPLHYATCASVAELLIKKGARVDASNAQGLTPLHLASDRGVALALVRAGAAVNGRDRCGNTPLHLSMYNGLGPTREYDAPPPVDAGLEPDAGTRYRGILANLIRLGNLAADVIEDVVRSRQVGDVLVAHGADPSLVNGAGRSAKVVGEMARKREDLDD